MRRKPLWKIAVVTRPEAEDAVAGLLVDFFKQPAAIYSDVESGRSTVTVYVEQKPAWRTAQAELVARLACVQSGALKLAAGEVSLEKVRRENWAESWKRHFHPIEIGDALLVKPSWSRQRAKKKQAVVILDPGLSFGTGQHPTTGFCLQQVAELRFKSGSSARRIESKPSFLDIGTGSGILAIAAAKLGYAPCEAFDFDPEAVRVAAANAGRNRVSDKIRLRQADVTRLPKRGAGRFDLVCANLISNLLISEHARVISTVKPGGVLVLAGILQKEFSQVQKIFEAAGLQLIARRVENEWCSGAFLSPGT